MLEEERGSHGSMAGFCRRGRAAEGKSPRVVQRTHEEMPPIKKSFKGWKNPLRLCLSVVGLCEDRLKGVS